LFQVFPVIFNVGINEEQTIAEKFGNTHLQEYLNSESWMRTSKYYDMVRFTFMPAKKERWNRTWFFPRIGSLSAERSKINERV